MNGQGCSCIVSCEVRIVKRPTWLPGAAGCLGMLALILDGQTALAGATQGVQLCIQSIVPSLFPFFLLSIYLTRHWMGTFLPALKPLGRLLGIPAGAEALLIPGFLGGYPVGAQSVAAAWQAGCLSKETAQRLLPVCSNPGPAFLFGMVALFFPAGWMVWVLWGVILLGAIITAQLLSAPESPSVSLNRPQPLSLSQAMAKAVEVTALVCGWVIWFRVVLAILERWVLWLLPLPAQVAAAGLLELSNGCCALDAIASVRLRFALCAGLLSFGGLCVALQTASVTAGLSLRWYLLGKLTHAGVSVALSLALFHRKGPLFLGSALLMLLILRKRRIASRKGQILGV